MKKNFLKNRLPLVLMVLAITGSLAFSQPAIQSDQGPQKVPACQKMIPNLTSDQEAAIEQLRTKHLKAMNELNAKIHLLRAELETLEIAEKPDQNAIETKIDALYKEKALQAKEISRHQQAVRQLLTEEQRVYFDSQKRCNKEQGPMGPRGCQKYHNQ